MLEKKLKASRKQKFMKYLTNSENVCQHFISKVFFQLSTIESFHEFYSELIHKQLDLMGLTYCEILNEINLSQVNLKSNSQPNTLPRQTTLLMPSLRVHYLIWIPIHHSAIF